LENGPNRVMEFLEDLGITEVRPIGSWEEEFQALLSPLPRPGIQLQRTRMDFSHSIGEGKETSHHLVRLYVRDEIANYLEERKEPARQVALKLATTSIW
jgi:hypothetical protein